MSANIYDVWKCGPNHSIFELVALATLLRETQVRTMPAEKAKRISTVQLAFPQHVSKFFEVFEAAPMTAAIVIELSMFPIMLENWNAPVWKFPANESNRLKDSLQKHANSYGMPCDLNTIKQMSAVAKDIYEAISMAVPSLCFLGDKEGNTYVKGFGLTSECSEILNEKFKRFDYTDATDMDAADFPELQAELNRCGTTDEKNQLLSDAQRERGKVWDDILSCNPNCTYRCCGLSYDLISIDTTGKTEWRKAIRDIVAELFDIWKRSSHESI